MSVPRPLRWIPPVVQAGQDGDTSVAQQFEMQGIGKPANQNTAETAARRRKGLRVACQLFFGRCQHAQEVTAEAIGLLFVSGKRLGNFGLGRRFKGDLPGHSLTPSDCAIWARLLP